MRVSCLHAHVLSSFTTFSILCMLSRMNQNKLAWFTAFLNSKSKDEDHLDHEDATLLAIAFNLNMLESPALVKLLI